MIDPDPVALSWWTALSPKDRARYRRRVYRGDDRLIPPHGQHLATAGLDPPGWWITGPDASTADNDAAHRVESFFEVDHHYLIPDPVRRLLLTDLDRTPLTDPDLDTLPRWWQRRRSRSR